MKLGLSFKIMFLMFFLAACGGGTKKGVSLAEKLTQDTGIQHDVVKSSTKVTGYIVIRNNATGVYTAYNTKNFNEEMSLSQYLGQAREGDVQRNLSKGEETKWVSESFWVDQSGWQEREYWDEELQDYQYETVWVDDGYWDTREVLRTITTYTNLGNNMVFEEKGNFGKDLEKMGQRVEAYSNQNLSGYFSHEFGLSEKRSKEVARLLKSYNRLKKTRALTEADQDIFSKRVIGLDSKRVNKAITSFFEGEREGLDELIHKAAYINETTPEHMESILETFLQ